MLFNNPVYILFLFFVYLVYWGLSRQWQNRFLLLASYFFYSCWNIKLLPLIFFCSLSAYFVANQLLVFTKEKHRNFILALGLILNFISLMIFKYYDFFVTSFVEFCSFLGFHANYHLLNFILPVGISFYTFQSASYIVDVYRGKIEPCTSVIDFLLYISFFPQLVAGPIERASTMLPQISKVREFNLRNARYGIALICYGIFKKILIADNLAVYVDRWYGDVGSTSGFFLMIGTLFFSFQIYCDFSGYSDVAIGSGRLLGFHLSRNFNFPYFSPNPSEFWRRWHITLMTWLRDYIYIPLGGNRYGPYVAWANMLAVFFISGLWHGARWNFIFWGVLNGVILICYLVLKQKKFRENKEKCRLAFISAVFCTYVLICLSWIFFRVETISDGFIVLTKLFTDFSPDLRSLQMLVKPLTLLFGFVGLELIIYRLGEFKLESILVGFRLYFVCVMIICITILFGLFQHVPFIYFQF